MTAAAAAASHCHSAVCDVFCNNEVVEPVLVPFPVDSAVAVPGTSAITC
jgi:hypothetical protein